MFLLRDSFPRVKPYSIEELRLLIMLVFGKIWDRTYWAIKTLSLRPLLESRYERYHFVAETGSTKRIVGFVSTCARAPRRGRYLSDIWGLHMLCVDRNYRRSGIGTILTKRVISCAKQKGARLLFLAVSRKNLAALNLYKKIGFEFGEKEFPLVYMFLRPHYTRKRAEFVLIKFLKNYRDRFPPKD